MREENGETVLYSYNGDSVTQICEYPTDRKRYELKPGFLQIDLDSSFFYIYEDGEYSFYRYKYIKHVGSSRSSKSWSIEESIIRDCEQNNAFRVTVWRDTKASLGETVWKDFKKLFPASGRSYKFPQDTRPIFFPNGSTIEPQGDDTTNAHGLTQNKAWLNEPYKMSKDTFDQIDQRADQIILDINPTGTHWSDELEKHPRCKVIHSTFQDNPFCPIEMKLKILSYDPGNPVNIENGTADNYKWQVYGLGLKAEKENRVFRGWKKITRAEYDALDVPEIIGCDWGKNHNWGIISAKFYDGVLYLRELNYASETDIMKSLPLNVLQDLKSQEKEGENLGIVSYMFSKLGINKKQTIICDNNRPLKIAMLRRCGWEYAYPAQKGQGSIKDGVDLVESIPVCYTDDSPNLENEYENYSYPKDRYGVVMDEPEDDNNHLCDPTRYIVQHLAKQGLVKAV